MKHSIDARACPGCGSKQTRIVESRINPHDGYLIRYRECNYCKTKYRTYEIKDLEWRQLHNLKYDITDFVEKLKQRLDKA